MNAHGVRASTVFETPGGITMTARGVLGWRRAYGDVNPSIAVAFNGGQQFGVYGVPIARNAAVIEAGLDMNVRPNMKLGISYNGQIASDAKDHGIKGNFEWKF